MVKIRVNKWTEEFCDLKKINEDIFCRNLSRNCKNSSTCEITIPSYENKFN